MTNYNDTLNKTRVEIVVFEETHQYPNFTYADKIVMSVLRDLDENEPPLKVVSPVVFYTPVGTKRTICNLFDDVASGTWMGSHGSAGLLDTENDLMAVFEFFRLLPVYGPDNQRNQHFTGIRGRLITEEETFDFTDNMLVDVIVIDRHQSYLMNHEGLSLERAIQNVIIERNEKFQK